MSKKDYQMIAAALKDTRTVGSLDEGTVRQIIYVLARTFAADNPNFDHMRFSKACTPTISADA